MNTLGKIGIAIIILAFSINAMNAQEGKWDLTPKSVRAYETEKINPPKEYPFEGWDAKGVRDKIVGDTLVIEGVKSLIYETEGVYESLEYFFVNDVLVKTVANVAAYTYYYPKGGIYLLIEDLVLLKKLDIDYEFDGKVLSYASSKGITTVEVVSTIEYSYYSEKWETYQHYTRTRTNPNK